MRRFAPLIACALAAGLGSPLQAQKLATASLSVSSSMTQNTCYINGTQQNGTAVTRLSIQLPTVTKADFPSAGKLGPVVVGATTNGFNITLTSCPANTRVALSLDGSGSVDTLTGTYKNTHSSRAHDMNVLIVNAEGGANTALNPMGTNSIVKTTDEAGQAGFLLGARYYSVAPVTAGGVTATAGFNITYP